MFNFKACCLWILLAVFLSGKMHSEIYPHEYHVAYDKHQKDVKAKLKKSADTAKARFTRHKNKKPRGKRVVNPQISNVAFSGFIIYKVFKLSYTESVNASFRHCLNLKRGPPVA